MSTEPLRSRDEDRLSSAPPHDGVFAERRALTNVAYRLLGSLTDAEDAVQETYARWFALAPGQREAVMSPGGWLTTVVSRVCLDQLRSARVRREQYVGEWLPEPVPSRAERPGPAPLAGDPADRITLDESVDMALLVVLDTMTPAERVSFVLHDVFGYPFAEIAAIVGRNPGACRQLASSARRRVRDARPAEVSPGRRAAVVRDFKDAWQAGDVGALVRLLDPSVIAVADGGGRVAASPVPIVGRRHAADYLVWLTTRHAGACELLERTVNGRPGLAAYDERGAVAVYAFQVAEQGIRRIWVVRNPDKLGPWAPR